MRLSRAIANVTCCDGTIVITHMTFVTATIDVTCCAALYVGIGSCCKPGGVFCKGLSSKKIVQTTGASSGVDIFLYLATKQCNVCRTIDVTTER